VRAIAALKSRAVTRNQKSGFELNKLGQMGSLSITIIIVVTLQLPGMNLPARTATRGRKKSERQLIRGVTLVII